MSVTSLLQDATVRDQLDQIVPASDRREPGEE